MVHHHVPERLDQRRRRKRGQQRIAAIHHRGPEPQGQPLLGLPRQGLAHTGHRNRAGRHHHDEPHHEPHQQCGPHGSLVLSARGVRDEGLALAVHESEAIVIAVSSLVLSAA